MSLCRCCCVEDFRCVYGLIKHTIPLINEQLILDVCVVVLISLEFVDKEHNYITVLSTTYLYLPQIVSSTSR